MSPRRISFLSLLPLVLQACGSSSDFSAPRAVPAEQRPTHWSEPDRTRLRVADMRAPAQQPQDAAVSFTGTTPAGWETQPSQPQRFRDLIWRVAGDASTECYLTAFVGGGVEQNVARWYGQFDAAPAPVEGLPLVEMAGQPARLLELSGSYQGKPGQAMALVFLAKGDGVTTLKFTGPKAVVEQHREAFLGLARSLREQGGSGAGAAPQAPTKPAAPTPQDAAKPPATMPSGGPTAATPAGWETQPSQPQRFRDLIWRVAGDASTECYLTAFVGGGVQQNVARWFGQFGASPKPIESLPTVEMDGRPAHLLELAGSYQGKAGQAMALVFLAKDDGVTTLKFTGPEATVKQHRDAFLALAKSLRLAGGAAAGATSAPAQPSPQVPAKQAELASAPFSATVPAGWVKKDGSTRILHHTFGAEGEVYLSQLGGGVRQMLDIWRGEVGLAAATDAEFAAVGKLPMLGGEGSFLDVTGDFHSMSGKEIPGARMLVGAFLDGNSIVFCKLVGKAGEVAPQVDAFKTFCASLRRNS